MRVASQLNARVRRLQIMSTVEPRRRKYSLARIAAVTAGLVVAGAIGGAVAGSLTALLAGQLHPGAWTMNDALMLVTIGAMFGAPCGAVLLPTASWLSLRH